MNLFRCLLAACLLLGALWSAPAAATPSFDNCTAFLPQPGYGRTIEDPGVYCLDHDLVVDGDGIEIWSGDVTVDCKGFSITRSTFFEYSIGIRAQDQRGVVVRNCDVRNFGRGMYLYTGEPPRDNVGYLVEDNVLHGNKWGLDVGAPGSVVRRNRVFGSLFGIHATYAMTVKDNIIVGDRTPGAMQLANGIGVFQGQGALVEGNVIRGLYNDVFSVSGISANSNLNPGSVRVHDNVVVGEGQAGTVGIECGDDKSTADDNVVTGFPTGMTGCVDAGDNDVSP